MMVFFIPPVGHIWRRHPFPLDGVQLVAPIERRVVLHPAAVVRQSRQRKHGRTGVEEPPESKPLDITRDSIAGSNSIICAVFHAMSLAKLLAPAIVHGGGGGEKFTFKSFC